MDFEPSQQQQMIADGVSQFVQGENGVPRFRKLRETDFGWDKDIWRQMGEYGWLAIAFPESTGGIGGEFVDMALILEQLGRGLAPEPYIPSVVLAGSMIERLGSAEQQQAFLQPMLDGESSLAVAYAEQNSRYQLNICDTQASRSGGDWRIRGRKTWVLNGHAANQIIVIARTSGDVVDKDGLSAFIVPGDAPGLNRIPTKTMDGQRAALIELDNVQVLPDALLGEEGQAFSALEWAIDRGAAAACAEGQGHLNELLGRTVEYLKVREQFGTKIGAFQALQHRAADMLAETELCRGMMLLAALKVDSPDPSERRREISAAKAHLNSAGWFVQENAIQLHGGIGVTDEQDIGLYFKRLRVLQSLFGDEDYHIGRIQDLPEFV